MPLLSMPMGVDKLKFTIASSPFSYNHDKSTLWKIALDQSMNFDKVLPYSNVELCELSVCTRSD